jgi:hypothetical protein
MNRMKSLRFPVKGVGGFNLILSDIGVVVAIVSSVMVLFVRVSEFHLLSKYQVSSSQSLEGSVYQSIRVSWCQGVGVRCKDTGTFVGESTLLLDFRTLKTKRSTVYTLVFVAKRFSRMRRKKPCISSK